MFPRFAYFLMASRALAGLALALADGQAAGRGRQLPVSLRVRRAGVADRQAVGV